jgi:hypothetical protein
MDAGKQVEAWLLNCAVLSEAEVSHMGYGEAGRSIVAELQHEDKRQVVEALLLSCSTRISVSGSKHCC